MCLNRAGRLFAATCMLGAIAVLAALLWPPSTSLDTSICALQSWAKFCQPGER